MQSHPSVLSALLRLLVTAAFLALLFSLPADALELGGAGRADACDWVPDGMGDDGAGRVAVGAALSSRGVS